MSEYETRTLVVTGWNDVATLANGNILYEVFCNDESGKPVDLPFRAFQELEADKPTEFEIRPFDSVSHGRTFTLIPVKRESRTKKLQKEVAVLTERVNELENTFEARVRSLIEDEAEARAKKMVGF